MSSETNVKPIIHEPTRPIWEDPQVNNPTPTTVPIVILIDSFSPNTLNNLLSSIPILFVLLKKSIYLYEHKINQYERLFRLISAKRN